MSSDDGKADSSEAGPPSRSNARVASAWGAARDALAAVRNLEVLLRSGSVAWKTILDLVPELRSSAGVLRQAFERATATEPAASAVGDHGRKQIGDLDGLLDAMVGGQADRRELAVNAGGLADELEATVDLLALLDRAAAPALTEVTLDLVAREVGRMSSSARGREVVVRFEEARPDWALATDPYVLGPLLTLLVASIHASGVTSAVLRARSSPAPQFVVEAAAPADQALPTLAIRVMPWIAPSEVAARRVAELLGATISFEPGRRSIVVSSDKAG